MSAARERTTQRWLMPRMGRGSAALAAAPAIRVPEGRSASVFAGRLTGSPQIYVHEGARQSLERRLEAAFMAPVILSITDNQHSIVSHARQGAIHRVRLHHMFLDAPSKVVDSLVRYISKGDRESSVRVGLYIEENGYRLARRRRKIQLVTKGHHHDLLDIFEDVKRVYFAGSFSGLITWGRRAAKGTSRTEARKTIKLGSYNSLDRIVRVNPVLDKPWVPRYFVAFVIYHEMLHHVFPHPGIEGRRALHPPAFLEREREFRRFERASEWERRHIGRLLRAN